MKLTIKLKITVLLSLIALYVTGAMIWILGNWFLHDSGMGPEPSPMKSWWLQIHGMIGLWFFILFGYLFNSHIQPAWVRGKKLKSGLVLTLTLAILCLTVPALYYVGQDSVRLSAAQIHTYLGLASIAVFLVHYFTRMPSTSRPRPKPKR